jgi:hypothetical protein
LLIPTLLLTFRPEAQGQVTVPDVYTQHLSRADSLAAAGDFRQSAVFYEKAFASFGGKGGVADKYKAAQVYMLAGNKDACIQMLMNLCRTGYFWDHPKVAKDPVFQPMAADPAFLEAVKCIQASQLKNAPDFNFAWRDMLEAVTRADQAIRDELNAAITAGADNATLSLIMKRMERIDSANTRTVADFLDEHAWQGPKVIDFSGSRALFLVLVHARLEVQSKYLAMVKEAGRKQWIPPMDVALFEDKLSVARDGTQIYGSQLGRDENGQMFLYPIIDEPNVNKRRMALGLEPIEDYLKLFNLSYPIKKQ